MEIFDRTRNGVRSQRWFVIYEVPDFGESELAG